MCLATSFANDSKKRLKTRLWRFRYSPARNERSVARIRARSSGYGSPFCRIGKGGGGDDGGSAAPSLTAELVDCRVDHAVADRNRIHDGVNVELLAQAVR